jgi:type IV pilus assembly protein PilP
MIFLLLMPIYGYSRIEDVFEGQTDIKNPFKLRDPFQTPKFKSNAQKKRKQRARGILNNINSLKDKFDTDSIVIVGVLIGKNRRVIVKAKGKNYTLKEGDTYGQEGPEIKAILAGGVILVEKITNIYGEDEFIETVVPISK